MASGAASEARIGFFRRWVGRKVTEQTVLREGLQAGRSLLVGLKAVNPS